MNCVPILMLQVRDFLFTLNFNFTYFAEEEPRIQNYTFCVNFINNCLALMSLKLGLGAS